LLTFSRTDFANLNEPFSSTTKGDIIAKQIFRLLHLKLQLSNTEDTLKLTTQNLSLVFIFVSKVVAYPCGASVHI